MMMLLLLPMWVCAEPRIIDIGEKDPGAELGFGWGERENDGQQSFIWMRRLEADIWLSGPVKGRRQCTLRAVPFYQPHRKQRIGLLINGRLVKEWVCPHVPKWAFYTFEADIPDGLLNRKRNRLILRTAYKAGPGDREVSLAVDKITLQPAGD